jgi:hypothetical protein
MKLKSLELAIGVPNHIRESVWIARLAHEIDIACGDRKIERKRADDRRAELFQDLRDARCPESFLIGHVGVGRSLREPLVSVLRYLLVAINALALLVALLRFHRQGCNRARF